MTDTIAAIATAVSNAGISIIRVSGSEAIQIVDEIFVTKGGKHILNNVASHTIHYGFIQEQEEMIDEVMVSVMKAPKSYTAEDVVEINCHGGVLVTNKILKTVLSHGARIAEPGEFTKRAFLNGRIDLTKAEAIMDLIEAKSDYALKASENQLQGKIYDEVVKLRKKIIYEIAFIESAIDDPEHISLEGYGQELAEVVKKEKEKLKRLIDSFSEGKMIREGIRTVIVGKPNAGKSSLLNCLVGEEKAIVTDIAGTTRDVLEETIILQGISLKMMDTAGIRNTEDTVEKIGVERARTYAKDADLILYVVDTSTELDENDEEILELLKEKKAIVLLNKSDLTPVVTVEMLQKKTSQPIIPISARMEQGVDRLEEKIREMFFQGDISFNDEVYITNVRHKNALEDAYASLTMVENSIAMEMPEDFFSIDLMSAYEALGSITGESVGEDLVNEIFSKFCTGK